jgi:serine protease inhibitor
VSQQEAESLHETRPPALNMLISPVSLSTALAITYNGAAGDTAQAMADGLA